MWLFLVSLPVLNLCLFPPKNHSGTLCTKKVCSNRAYIYTVISIHIHSPVESMYRCFSITLMLFRFFL